jgi:hypothetical protein
MMNLDFDASVSSDAVPDGRGGTPLATSSSSSSSSSSLSHSQQQKDNMVSWFLVSDDEGDDEKYPKSSRRSHVQVEDYSPIPVRSLSTITAQDKDSSSMLIQPMMRTTTLLLKESLNVPDYSCTKVGNLASGRGSDCLFSQPQKPLLGKFALQPKTSSSLWHAQGTRFSTRAKTGHETVPSSNLYDANHESNTETWNPATTTTASDDYKHHQETPHDFSTSSKNHFVELSLAHSTSSSHLSKGVYESFLNQVAFVPSHYYSLDSTTTGCSSSATMTIQSSTSSRLQRRPRARSQSIAIKKRGYGSSSITTAQQQQQQQESFHHEDSLSYNERLYDNATWRMYHRIVDHRRNQLLQHHRQELDDDDGVVVVGGGGAVESREASSRLLTRPRHGLSSSTNSTSEPTNNLMLLPSGYVPHLHHMTSSASGSSSVASSNMGDYDDDDYEDAVIFDMEL